LRRRKLATLCQSWAYCSFGLAVENTTPDEISQKLGLERDGGMVLSNQLQAIGFECDSTVSTWNIRSRCDPQVDASEHLVDLLNRLEPHAQELCALRSGGALAEVRVCILSGDITTRFEVPSGIAERLGRLNVGLKVQFTPEEEWDDALAGVHPDECD
jgi:hypothetical protein